MTQLNFSPRTRYISLHRCLAILKTTPTNNVENESFKTGQFESWLCVRSRSQCDSIEALKTFNRYGYGHKSSPLVLDLVYNPVGASLPGPQSGLDTAYHKQLYQEHGIVFDSLLTITNMPIRRFADSLLQSGQYAPYMETLTNAFNVHTVDQLMCRNTVNVAWDGKFYDCDFNAAIGMGRPNEAGQNMDIWNIGVYHVPRPVAVTDI